MGARTLDRVLRDADAAAPGLRFHLDHGPEWWPAARLSEEASVRARALSGLGLGRGAPVGILGPNRPEWAAWAFGAWEAGAVVVPLAYPMRVLHQPSARHFVDSLVRAAGCRAVVAEPSLARLVGETRVVPWDRVPEEREDPEAPEPEDPAVIQFTSGTTDHPKGAVLSHRAILDAIGMLGRAMGVEPDRERFLGWLPFFHDNGLFGYLVRPLALGFPGEVLSTEGFARDPAGWFRILSETGATVTTGPSSAWAVALRRLRHPAELDLSSVRFATLAAEAIDPEVVEALRARGAEMRLRPEAVAGGFGMAEATLGITVTAPGRGTTIDRVDRGRLAREGRAVPARGDEVKAVPSCGVPLPGVEIRVMGADEELPERHVGELLVRSPALFSGYVDGAAELEDGWLRTGDLGYLADGEFHHTGRRKDVLVVMGRNYGPEDVERAAGAVEGIRAGRCAAFAPPGAPDGRVVLVAEVRRGVDRADLVDRVRRAVAERVGLVPTEVMLAAPDSVLKTTSGKIRRGAVRDAYLRGEIAPAG